MNRYLYPFFVCIFLFYPLSASSNECVSCHIKETPAAVRQWQESAHFERINCQSCHGDNHEAILNGDVLVDAKVCGSCHQRAYDQHRQSKHGLGLHSGWGCTRNLESRNPRECRFCHQEGSTLPMTKVQCARFLKQTSEMGRLGCNRCHQVENMCSSCHSNHMTELALVQKPNVCATCHMGPDHPQWEMWQTSRHGVLYESLGESGGPTCQQCHMPQGTHDVSFGITMTPAMKQPEDGFEAKREEMISVCTQCHGESFSRRELAAGDEILKQSLELIQEAEEIIKDLADHDRILPSVNERPAHPLRGHELVLDGQMLYEDISHIERLFFKMKKYDLAKTIKGAFHQNPAYTHWYGNAELKMTLVDIRSEAIRLGALSSLSKKSSNENQVEKTYMTVETELQALKRKYDRGVIDLETYERLKKDVLDSVNY